jgi:hypothetical protein
VRYVTNAGHSLGGANAQRAELTPSAKAQAGASAAAPRTGLPAWGPSWAAYALQELALPIPRGVVGAVVPGTGLRVSAAPGAALDHAGLQLGGAFGHAAAASVQVACPVSFRWLPIAAGVET